MEQISVRQHFRITKENGLYFSSTHLISLSFVRLKLQHSAKLLSTFKALNTEILGVSVDSKHSHRAWINTSVNDNGLGKLNFPLAADITKSVSRDYGVLIEEEGIALRGLFIINPEGEVKYQVVNHNDVGRSVEETLRVLQALQSGGLCPINWKPGEKHLVAK